MHSGPYAVCATSDADDRLRGGGHIIWLFAGSLRAGKRVAVMIMSLVQSARLNGHGPYAYLKDVLARLPSHPAVHVDELLPHRWQSAST